VAQSHRREAMLLRAKLAARFAQIAARERLPPRRWVGRFGRNGCSPACAISVGHSPVLPGNYQFWWCPGRLNML